MELGSDGGWEGWEESLVVVCRCIIIFSPGEPVNDDGGGGRLTGGDGRCHYLGSAVQCGAGILTVVLAKDWQYDGHRYGFTRGTPLHSKSPSLCASVGGDFAASRTTHSSEQD